MTADSKTWIIKMGDFMQTTEAAADGSSPEAEPARRSATRPSSCDASLAHGQGTPPRRSPTPVNNQPAARATKTASQQQSRPEPRTARQPRTAAQQKPRPQGKGIRASGKGLNPKAQRGAGNRREGRRLSPGRLVLLTYLLGPFSFLATAAGRRQRIWAAGGLVCIAAAVALLLSEHGLLTGRDFSALLMVWLLSAAVMTLVGSAVWVRALVLTGRTFRTSRFARLPSWCRKPWSTGLLSLLVPGVGYFLLGRMRRAVVALAAAGPALLALLVVAHAGRMWQWQQGAGGSALSSHTLEWVFLSAGVLATLGLVMWFVQVLDTVGMAAVTRSLAVGGHRRIRSDWIAGALVATLIAAVFLFQPTQLAGRLGGLATDLRQEGLQVIPLNLAEAAMNLDPGQPRYAIQVAELCNEMGRRDRAAELREQLDERWHVYATLASPATAPAEVAAGQPAASQSEVEPN